MTSYEFALICHIASLTMAFFLAGAVHAAEWRAPGAKSVADLRAISAPLAWGKYFPIALLGLLGFGSWMIHLSKGNGEEFTFSNGWVWTAIVAIVFIGASGGAILAPHGKKLGMALATTPDGPVTPELRHLSIDPFTWAVSHMNGVLALGVVCNMVVKPDAASAIIILVVAFVVGSALGALLAKRAPA